MVATARLMSVIVLSAAAATACGAPDASTAQTGLDVSRLSEVAAELPEADYIVKTGRLTRYPEENTEIAEDFVLFGTPAEAEPQECVLQLKPVKVQPGASGMRVSGDPVRGDGGIRIVAYTDTVQTSELMNPACQRFRYSAPQLHVEGTVQQLTPPVIDDAGLVALKNQVDENALADYYYGALLEDPEGLESHVYVSVQARLDRDAEYEPLVPDLLVKAVAAVRGR